MQTCAMVNNILNIIVQFPKVNAGNAIDKLYGMAEIGEVPSIELVVTVIPKVVKTIPRAKTAYRCINSLSVIFLSSQKILENRNSQGFYKLRYYKWYDVQ